MAGVSSLRRSRKKNRAKRLSSLLIVFMKGGGSGIRGRSMEDSLIRMDSYMRDSLRII
jgi:hypothetical protein